MSLTSCLRKSAGYIDKSDRSAILVRARELRAGGSSTKEAALTAVDDQIEQVKALLEDHGRKMERAQQDRAARTGKIPTRDQSEDYAVPRTVEELADLGSSKAAPEQMAELRAIQPPAPRHVTTRDQSEDYAIHRTLEQLAELGASGIHKSPDRVWYSQLQRAFEAAPERLGSMSAPQWIQWLKANAAKLGVKQDEITWSGIEDYLKLRGKDKISRDELASWVGENGVQVTETQLSDSKSRLTPAEREEVRELNDLYRRSEEGEDGVFDAGDFDRLQELEGRDENNGVGYTKYAQYTLPGGSNDRELLLTLPLDVGRSKEEIERDASELKRIGNEIFEILSGRRALYDAEKEGELTRLEGEKDQIVARIDKSSSAHQGAFHSNHWDQPNVLAHIRLNDRTDADGSRVLFVEELQSDFGQDTKKQKDAIAKAVDADFEGIVARMKGAGALSVECD